MPTGTEGDARGRVVMLVDNAVDGDSRVQKVARSAAAAGWDVTLLGRSPDGRPREWLLGGAHVRLLAMGSPRPAGPGHRRRAATARALGRLRRPVVAAYARFWSVVLGNRAWRRLAPELWDFEPAYGPVIDELAPDLIHAHDHRMLGVGARAALRARARGRPVKLLWDAHEFLPGIRPANGNPRWLPAHRAYEREYAAYADAVVTVSPRLAELLRREHGLARPPAVVLNAPAGTGADPPAPLRSRCGIGPDVPLMVYCGAAAPQRGLGLVVDALPRLPGVHAAFVVNQPDGAYVQELIGHARALGVADRVHALGYVPHDQVVRLLAGADVGLILMHHWLNHEIALPTKFFEYSHARLPLVVSDVRTIAATVRRTGQGEVFRAEDVGDFVRATRAVLAEPGRYRRAYDAPGLLAGWTWEAQAEVLDGVYAGLLPGPARDAADASTGPVS